MNRRVFGGILILMIGLLSFGVVAAQNATQEPTPTNEIGLGDVVGNKAQYYGQQVTVEGTIEEVIDVRAFILGDQATLNDHRLLVIDNSPQDFDIGVRKDQKVRVIGVLCPSFNEGGWNQLVGANSVNGPSPTQGPNTNATQQTGALGIAPNMAACSANASAGNTSTTNGTAGNTTGSNTTGSNGNTSALAASGGVDQSSTNPNSLQNQNPGTPGTAESSASAATAGGSGATSNQSSAAATVQVAPTLMATEQTTSGQTATEQMTPGLTATEQMTLTPGQTAAQQMANGNFDISQMYIRPDLRDFTVLLLNELHITYLPS